MKKSYIFIFTFIFLISLASAFYTEPVLFTQKNNYQPGETFIARLEGNFAQNLTSSNFKFYEGKKEVSLDYDKVNYNGIYYFYIYFEQEGNFTITLQNILYKDSNSVLKSKTLTENITVSKKEINATNQILSIKPGFVYGPEKPKLVLTNKGLSPLDVSYSGQKITIQPLESQSIFPTASIGVSTLQISSYETFEVPIILLPGLVSNQTNQTQTNITQNQTNQAVTGPLILSSSSFNVNSTESIPLIKTLGLTNNGNSDITNIQLTSLNPSISLSSLPSTLSSNKTSSANITFLSSSPGFFLGNISLTYEYKKSKFSKTITFQFYSFPKITQPVEKKNCEQLNGKICVNQKCTGNYTFTSAGEYCCLGNCEAITANNGSSGSFKWIAGIVLFIILGVIGYLAWKKYKKTKPASPKETIENKVGAFEKRIQGGVTRT